MELLLLLIMIFWMLSIIVLSYEKQVRKYRRKQEWMKQQLKNGRNND